METNGTIALKSVTLEELESIKSSVRINIQTDPELRIKYLFIDYRTFLRTSNWYGIIKKIPKLSIAQVFSSLKPTILQEKIKSDLPLDKHDLRNQWRSFYQHIILRLFQ